MKKLTVDYYMGFVPAGERASFLAAVQSLANDIGVLPVSLLAVMFNESGLNPAAYHAGVKGGGLIGFMPGTAKMLGTSVPELIRMSRVNQMYYVRKYFERRDKKFKGIEELYLYTFYPYAIGQPDHYIFGSERSMNYARLVASSNPGFDLDKNGLITMGEMRRYMKGRWGDILRQERRNRIWKNAKISAAIIGSLVVILLLSLLIPGVRRRLT